MDFGAAGAAVATGGGASGGRSGRGTGDGLSGFTMGYRRFVVGYCSAPLLDISAN